MYMFESTLFRYLQLALPEKRYKQSYVGNHVVACALSKREDSIFGYFVLH